ncbi:hypothetical protein ACFLWJ_01040 [Chloroflexota bacterium]
MSKLLDKLEKAAQGEAKPFGFATSVSKSALPQIMTIARLPHEAEAKPLIDGNVDAILFSVVDASKAIATFKKKSKELSSIIWGIEAESISKKEAEQLVQLGCDFIALKLISPAIALMCEDSLGKLITASPSIDDSLISALNVMDVDAVVIEEDASVKTITLERLMMYHRITAMVQQPILMSLPIDLAKENLVALHDAGINGLILDTATDKKIAELKKAIEALPKNKAAKNRKKRLNASLPNISSPSYEDES